MTNEHSFTVSVSELKPGSTITRFAPRGKVSPGTQVNLKGPKTTSRGKVITVDDNYLYGDKVICTIEKC